MTDDPVLNREWFVVAKSQDVSAGKPVAARLSGRDVVLWRTNDGIHAWLDLCVHRGAKLSLGTLKQGEKGECLVCPYHAWEYDSNGQCVRIPAHPLQEPPLKARAQVFRSREKYGLIWVCLGEPVRDVPDFPEWEDAAFRSLIAGPYVFEAHGPRVIENFLDVAHLGIVHAGLLGSPDHSEMSDYEVESSAEGITARNIRVWQPDPDGTGQAAEVRYTYEVERPLTASFQKHQGAQCFAMMDTVTPVSERESWAWVLLALNYAHEIPDEELLSFQDKVSLQDKAIVESQRPELLPLDLQAELHLRSDKTAIAYRRWLKELGLRYGTA